MPRLGPTKVAEMRPSRNHGLERLAEALADGAAIDWTLERSHHSDDAQRLAGLELLEAVSHVFEAASTPHLPVTTPFDWGPLRVVERIAEGSFGEVFRAVDPTLGREVALKLRKDPSMTSGPASKWLAEARRLARVRHPNVLTLHGADVHDGREGLWTDLLVGETLRERLDRLGQRPGDELQETGITLCSALAAIHAAGVVHGDIKVSNVLRESDGTLILLDLGSGAELLAPKSTPPRLPSLGPQGSPLTSAPEVLHGEAPTVASDLYSLGAMLFLLATNQPPYPASNLEELRSLAGSGERVSLRILRPDLPDGLILAIEKSLAVDPRDRFTSANAFADALHSSAGAIDQAEAPTRRVIPFVLGTLVAAIVLLSGLWWHQRVPKSGSSLIEQWELLKVGSQESPLRDGSKIHLGDPLGLEVDCARDTYLYLLNEDQTGNVFVLFPLPETGIGNPLPAGRHRLPGSIDGVPQNWIVTSSSGDEHFLLVAAASPLPTVERFAASHQRASADRTPRSQLAAQTSSQATSGGKPGFTDDVVRGVGGLVPHSRSSDSRLATLVESLNRDREDVWIGQLRLSNPP
jgi:serine/threonine protein kinase